MTCYAINKNVYWFIQDIYISVQIYVNVTLTFLYPASLQALVPSARQRVQRVFWEQFLPAYENGHTDKRPLIWKEL